MGIAGMGFMARVHSRALLKLPNAQIAAAWSKFPEEHARFREFAEKLGFRVPRCYTDLERFLGDSDVEAVICAIPWRFIYPIARRIIEHGKPALLECPPGSTPSEIRRLDRLARARGVPVMPGHCYRFAPCFRKAKEILAQKGAPFFFSFRELVPAASLARQWSPTSWIWDPRHGGPIPTMTVFAMDLARWLAESEARSLYASLFWHKLRDLNILGYAVTSLIRFRNGSTWSSEFTNLVTDAHGAVMNLDIAGDGYVLRVGGPERVELHTSSSRQWQFKLERPERWGHLGQDRHFISDVVQRGQTPAVSMRDAERAFRLSLAILQSASENRPVSP